MPTDLHFMPDGRLLVVAQRELTFGDGVRWQTYRRVANDDNSIGKKVAVDQDSRIYTGLEGKFSRIDLNADATWSYTPVAGLAPDAPAVIVPHNVTIIGDDWYWHSGGSIIKWRPGAQPLTIRHSGSTDLLFTLGTEIFVNDSASGRLSRLDIEAHQTIPVLEPENGAIEAITCTTAFAPGQILVGTAGLGLKLFDGTHLRPFTTQSLLARNLRINDLCSLGQGVFAAAVDTVGIVIFNREGRILQALDRALDHRLSRVRQLVYAPDGVIWALLNEGLARMEYPSPLSNFSPLVPTGLRYAHVLRFRDRLWIMSDNRLLTGVYDEDRRLVRFEDTTPAGHAPYHMGVLGDRSSSRTMPAFTNMQAPTGGSSLPASLTLESGSARAPPVAGSTPPAARSVGSTSPPRASPSNASPPLSWATSTATPAILQAMSGSNWAPTAPPASGFPPTARPGSTSSPPSRGSPTAGCSSSPSTARSGSTCPTASSVTPI
jgi:hypothetical protein